MNAKLGMDPGAALVASSSMRMQVDALTAIASDLLATSTAASLPQSYGIEPGDMVVAPWSISSLSSANNLIISAQSAATTLLQRIQIEADGQETASGNDFANLGGARGVIDSTRWWRNWIAMPRALFETPAALRMLASQPALWSALLHPGAWRLQNTLAAGSALRQFTRTTQTPGFVRSTYQWASNLKWQNYVDPNYMHGRGLHAAPPAWTNALHIDNPGFVNGAKTVATGIGKGFGVLGAGVGVLNIASGVTGMMDGDVSSGDAWALADGIVGTVTSIGSLAPPPAGLVFAGVGAAYTAGRWLFGADANGNTGIDKIGDFGKSVGNTVSDGAAAVGSAVSDGAEAVGDLVDDVWPW